MLQQSADPSALADISSIFPALTRIFYRALSILLVFGGIAVGASFYRMLTQPGWHAAFVLYVGLYIVACILFGLRKRLSLSFVFSALLVMGYIIGAVALWTGGLAATGIMHLALLCAFAGVFLGMRAGIIALFAGAGIATLAGIGVSTGLTQTLPNVAAYLSSPVTWVIHIASYLMYLIPLIVSVSGLRNRMMTSLRELQANIRRLEEEVSLRREAEEESRENAERYRELADLLPQAVAEFDLEGNFVYGNLGGLKMFGRTREELHGCNVLRMIKPDEHERLMRNIRKVLDGEESQGSHEYTALRKDGSTFPALLYGARILREGKVAGMRAILVDITERKQSEEKLASTLSTLRKAIGGTIQAIVQVVEMRDPYTAGHQRRVADLARSIATEMGLPPDTIEGVRVAAVIHDIGKVSVPAEILSKPGKLTQNEFELIKDHAETGYDILKDVEFPWPIAEMIRQHHERLDGSGYPRGLKGDDTLIEARVIALADVVEAIASHRPFRPAHGIEVALDEIKKNRGTLYDPKIVDACLRLFTERKYTFD